VVISCHAAKKSSFSPIFSSFALVYPQGGDNFSPVWERKNTPRFTGGSTSKKHALTPQPNSHSGDSQTKALSPKAAQSSARAARCGGKPDRRYNNMKIPAIASDPYANAYPVFLFIGIGMILSPSACIFSHYLLDDS